MRWKLSFLFHKLGLTCLARYLNRGHWFNYECSSLIECTCGLESAYWQEEPHPYRPRCSRCGVVAMMHWIVPGGILCESCHFVDPF